MEDVSSVYLELFEHEISMLRIQNVTDRIYNMLTHHISYGDIRYNKLYGDLADESKQEDGCSKQLKKNLWHYYNKMSEEDKLYIAVTYGIPEKVEDEEED